MNLNDVDSVAIYPAIGIARVGNSKSEYFIGSTIVGQPAQDDSDFRDSEGKIKRQAAQFYVYGLDKDGKILGELNLDQAGVTINWTVHIANKKAAWYEFDMALDIPAANGKYDTDGVQTPNGLPLQSPMRNREYQGAARKELMIEPSPQNISGKDVNGKEYQFNDGQINGKTVKLGEVRTDDAGRLIFLGGRGKSKSFNDTKLTTFANNEGWYDDTSDGPVNASVCITDDSGSRELKAIGAWVVTAPPDFAVGVQASTTGYDLLRNVAAQVHPHCITDKPEFFRDIYPMLSHQTINQWVNAGILRDYGWGSGYDFDCDEIIRRAANPSDKNRPFRESILSSCRNPDYKTQQTQAWPPLYGDAMTTSSTNEDPRAWLAVTELQYAHLEQWAKGNFDVVKPTEILKWDDMTPEQQANGLTEAALEQTLGGPFHPGCEFTWPMRHAIMYANDLPFRIKRRENRQENFGVAISPYIALAPGGPLDGSSPGDITKWMAVPWQSDTSSCLSAYSIFSGEYLPTFWPARVPNDVLTQDDFKVLQDPKATDDEKVEAFSVGQRKKWLRGFIYNDQGQFLNGTSIDDRLVGINKFVKHWDKAGIVLQKPLDVEPDSSKELFPELVWVETGRQLKDEKDQAGTDKPDWMTVNPRTLR
jgi:hypothetical protein